MKYVYLAVFEPTLNGFQVTVPDLPEVWTQGADWPSALEAARNAIEAWLWRAEQNDVPIPEASSRCDCLPECFINRILANTDEYRRANDNRAVKKTLSIPSWLNTEAERANAPFSQILQQGLKEYLASDRRGRR